MRNEQLLSLILTPVVTEKATMAEENNVYTFKVSKRANKHTVKEALKLMYGVEVAAVNMLNQQGKEKRTGRVMGRRNHYKKAMVTLAEGQSIDFEVQQGS